mmetsp:Transcript_37899/g.112214  ORF Transcript_37899/g.112214 Transcript_37899/m.112214 type:complete len:346 (+) Transcript_37899:82-1119(+)
MEADAQLDHARARKDRFDGVRCDGDHHGAMRCSDQRRSAPPQRAGRAVRIAASRDDAVGIRIDVARQQARVLNEAAKQAVQLAREQQLRLHQRHRPGLDQVEIPAAATAAAAAGRAAAAAHDIADGKRALLGTPRDRLEVRLARRSKRWHAPDCGQHLFLGQPGCVAQKVVHRALVQLEHVHRFGRRHDRIRRYKRLKQAGVAEKGEARRLLKEGRRVGRQHRLPVLQQLHLAQLDDAERVDNVALPHERCALHCRFTCIKEVQQLLLLLLLEAFKRWDKPQARRHHVVVHHPREQRVVQVHEVALLQHHHRDLALRHAVGAAQLVVDHSTLADELPAAKLDHLH